MQHLPKVNPTRTGDEFHASSLLTDSATTKPLCSAKSKPPTSKSTSLYELYGLSEEEIKIVRVRAIFNTNEILFN
ncbi:hypothetical protein KJ068_06730 [bacterium]|nr:hypothetical protein [bacterium]